MLVESISGLRDVEEIFLMNLKDVLNYLKLIQIIFLKSFKYHNKILNYNIN